MARTPDSNVAPLSAAAVMELARITGVPVDDAAMAARIAAGAANAVAAVREGLAIVATTGVVTFDHDTDYLAALERLADDAS